MVGGEAFAVDASMIVADAYRRRGVAKVEDLDPTSNRAVAEYLSVLDDAAFGGATPVEPKSISPTDPAARYTAAASPFHGSRSGPMGLHASQGHVHVAPRRKRISPGVLSINVVLLERPAWRQNRLMLPWTRLQRMRR
jgi:hypothetical protein